MCCNILGFEGDPAYPAKIFRTGHAGCRQNIFTRPRDHFRTQQLCNKGYLGIAKRDPNRIETAADFMRPNEEGIFLDFLENSKCAQNFGTIHCFITVLTIKRTIIFTNFAL